VARYKWHAEFFEGCSGVRAAKSAIIEADNADEAEKLARVAIGSFRRIEIRRMGTAQPARVILLSTAPTVVRRQSPRHFEVWALAVVTSSLRGRLRWQLFQIP
jgi:hypothetical protein